MVFNRLFNNFFWNFAEELVSAGNEDSDRIFSSVGCNLKGRVSSRITIKVLYYFNLSFFN